MELFIVFEEPEIRKDPVVRIATLVVWSLSLLQFCIVLTAVKRDESKVIPHGDQKSETKRIGVCSKFFGTEIWSLFASMVLQDGAFLTVRLYTIILHKFIKSGIIFFAFKNFLVIALLVYRIFVVCFRDDKHDDDDDEQHGLDARG